LLLQAEFNDQGSDKNSLVDGLNSELNPIFALIFV